MLPILQEMIQVILFKPRNTINRTA